MTGKSPVWEKLFGLRQAGTSVRTEVAAGVTTFLTMSYIIFVQPAVLSGRIVGTETGIDFGAALTATCIASAFATAIMGLYARYPIALAPGMGQNFFFLFTVIPVAAEAGFAPAWPAALGAVFVAGVLFLLLTLTPLREQIIQSIDDDLKHAIAVGIGLFIAFVGLKNAGLILADPGTVVKLNTRFGSPDLWVFAVGLLLGAGLLARGVPGAILWGILGSTFLALVLKLGFETWGDTHGEPVASSMLMTRFVVADAILAPPPSIAPTFLKLDIMAAFTSALVPMVVVLLFMDLFDTTGTLIGVGQRAGLLREGRLARGRRAMLADSLGTVAGSALGTSTVTSYIESAAGVEQGGRTGLTALTVALLFLGALFLEPVIQMIGNYPPVTTPALVLVGGMMLQSVTHIRWGRSPNAIPAFLIVIGIPLTFSIADGIALGLIAAPVVSIIAGRAREIRGSQLILAASLVLYFLFFRSEIGS